MSKILLTGHCGFIGSRIYKMLEESDTKGVGIDLIDGDDIRDKRRMEYLFETEYFDTVIHTAALTGARRGELYPNEYFDTNVIGTKNLVDLAEKYKVKKFIHFSSSSVRGDSIYGMSKLIGERIVERSKIPIINVIRPFTVIGENGRKDQVIKKWMTAIKNKKPIYIHGMDTTRNFTYVDDLVQFVKWLIDFDKDSGTSEMCNPNSIRLVELVYMFEKHFTGIEKVIKMLDEHEPVDSLGNWDSPFKPTDNKTIINKIIKYEKEM